MLRFIFVKNKTFGCHAFGREPIGICQTRVRSFDKLKRICRNLIFAVSQSGLHQRYTRRSGRKVRDKLHNEYLTISM